MLVPSSGDPVAVIPEIGPHPDALRRAHAPLYAATDDALEALRPGMTESNLHGALFRALTAQGTVA
ncbi:hypothetical protein [Meridianimarinicoccus roseus]|uniref:hypothetical protein n=1 Tax=Meridianimarinicoccus roseus TaxID=2072018 RepID=UPI001EE63708|nr:hypothetical protein [Meridianimarinicoccus roseus]